MQILTRKSNNLRVIRFKCKIFIKLKFNS